MIKKGLPLPEEIPNEITLQTFADTDRGDNLNYYDCVNDVFTKLKLEGDKWRLDSDGVLTPPES